MTRNSIWVVVLLCKSAAFCPGCFDQYEGRLLQSFSSNQVYIICNHTKLAVSKY